MTKQNLSYDWLYYRLPKIRTENTEGYKGNTLKKQKPNLQGKYFKCCRKQHKDKCEGQELQNCTYMKEKQEMRNAMGKGKATEVTNMPKEKEPVIPEAVGNLSFTSTISHPLQSLLFSYKE